MITLTQDNIFNIPAEALVNTVNCVGVMGKGLALEFKRRYPDMFQAYKTTCGLGQIRPGVLWIWKSPTDHIINFPTKRHWRDMSRYEDIEAGLVTLRAYLDERKPRSVAIPPLGCGNGGLSWLRVRKMIEFHLSDASTPVMVVEKT